MTTEAKTMTTESCCLTTLLHKLLSQAYILPVESAKFAQDCKGTEFHRQKNAHAKWVDPLDAIIACGCEPQSSMRVRIMYLKVFVVIYVLTVRFNIAIFSYYNIYCCIS